MQAYYEELLQKAPDALLDHVKKQSGADIKFQKWPIIENALSNPIILDGTSSMAKRLESTFKRQNSTQFPEKVSFFWGNIELGEGASFEVGDTTTMPEFLGSKYGDSQIKTFNNTAWWREAANVARFANGAEFLQDLIERFNAFKAYVLEKKTLAILRNMEKIDDILINKDKTIVSFPAVMKELEKKLGRHAFKQNPSPLYANQKTINKLVDDDTSKVIKMQNLNIVKNTDGTMQYGSTIGGKPTIVYDGNMEIKYHPNLPDDTLYCVRNSTLTYVERPRSTYRGGSALTNEGNGPIMLGGLHAIGGHGINDLGFSFDYAVQFMGTHFKGALGTDYGVTTGVSSAELIGAATSMYELKCEPEDSPVFAIYIK